MAPIADTRPADSDTTRPLPKGRATHAAILDAALGMALQLGLEGLSIGVLAEAMAMSKSGVFAHFGSREELQISVVREYHARFEAEVFRPAMAKPRGLPRMVALVESWVRRVTAEIDAGCLYTSGAVEFDGRPGPVRDALVETVLTWRAALVRAIGLACVEGHLHAATDPAQVLFEIHGLVLALNHDARFLRDADAPERARAAFVRVVADHATPAGLRSISADPAFARRPR